MGENQCRQGIPVSLTVKQFEEFVLPHLTVGRRGPAPTMSLYDSLWYNKAFQKCIINQVLLCRTQRSQPL